jgi:hypothetical protein
MWGEEKIAEDKTLAHDGLGQHNRQDDFSEGHSGGHTTR